MSQIVINKKKYLPSNIHTWLFYGLLTLIIYLPLPLGSNRLWAWALAEAWVFGLFGLLVIFVLQEKISIPSYAKKCWLPLVALLCFFVFTLLQLAPWDTSFPKPMRILNDINWMQFSLDPYATMQSSLKTLAFVCLFALIITLVNTEKKIKAVLMCFFLSGLFQSVYGSLMTLTGIEHIFFIEKYAYIGKATGTFVNRNHFANYVTLCTAAGTALLLIGLSNKKSSSIRETMKSALDFILSAKMLLRIGLAASVVGIVLSQSRMGNTAFFVSLSIAGFLWMILTKRFSKKSILLLASIILIDLLIVGQWFGFEKVKQRLQNTSVQSEKRDDVGRDTIVYIEDYFLFGSGGGSYYAVYPNYQSSDVKHFYRHAHNDYLQFLGEYGIVGTLFIAIFVLSSLYISLVTMIKRRSKTMQATGFCSLMVLIALLIHSQVDFNLQIMANAASAVILISLSWVARHLPVHQHAKRRRRSRTVSTPLANPYNSSEI